MMTIIKVFEVNKSMNAVKLELRTSMFVNCAEVLLYKKEI